jgi:sodium transport system permease protein
VHSSTYLVYLKDLKETLRDKRTLIRMLLFSVLMLPVVGHLMVRYSNSFEDKVRTEVLNFAIVGSKYLPEVAEAYANDEGFKELQVDDEMALMAAIKVGSIRFGLAVPDDAQEDLQDGGKATVALYYNNANSKSTITKERAMQPLVALSESKRDWRLTSLGVFGGLAKENLLNPLDVAENETATRREEIGERIGGMIAYFVFLICFMGCVFTAVDLGAGEKERGTLETLLMLPVPRRQLVLGKYLVVFTQGVVYSSLTLFSIAGWLALEARGSSGVTDEALRLVGGADLFLVWLMLLPVAAVFSAVLLALSIYARSFREASSLSGLANFLVVMAVIVAILPGIELTWGWALVPVTNVALAIRELIKGTMDYAMLLAILGSTCLVAFALLILCTWWFRRESVVFRE